ncbi:MAG TPA: UDP-3-O-(3-hydroxymyristoyl)glucosamine N-acyltransferase [Halomicronema sp.]
MKFSHLIEKLGENANNNSLSSTLIGDPEITGVTAVDEAFSGTLSYIEGARFAKEIATTSATALILPKQEQLIEKATERSIAWISTGDPRLLFAKAITLFYEPYHPSPKIHASAVVDPTAEIGEGVYIGAGVVIESGVKIGKAVTIHPNVVIYPDVEIGDRTILHANCTIHERTRIGSDCVIHSGAVIGAEGFGFVPTATGWYKMQQSGQTILEDGVEVGCNSTIDRPAVGETRVGHHTKIDNLVQIGHGCKIGANCAFAAQVGLAGGVKIGNNVILAGQVGIANQAKIGDRAIASAKAGIHNDIAPGEIVSGIPALPHKQFLKVSAVTSRLPEIYESLKQLQRHFKNKVNTP